MNKMRISIIPTIHVCCIKKSSVLLHSRLCQINLMLVNDCFFIYPENRNTILEAAMTTAPLFIEAFIISSNFFIDAARLRITSMLAPFRAQ